MVKRIGLTVAALFATGTAFLPGGASAAEMGMAANMTVIAPQANVLQATHRYGHYCEQVPVQRCDYYGRCYYEYVTRCHYRGGGYGGYGGGYRGGYGGGYRGGY